MAHEPDARFVRVLARAAKALQRQGARWSMTLRCVRVCSSGGLGARRGGRCVRHREVSRDAGRRRADCRA
eukprot:11676162-Alexandrium_andersonii.AAC.1